MALYQPPMEWLSHRNRERARFHNEFGGPDLSPATLWRRLAPLSLPRGWRVGFFLAIDTSMFPDVVCPFLHVIHLGVSQEHCVNSRRRSILFAFTFSPHR